METPENRRKIRIRFKKKKKDTESVEMDVFLEQHVYELWKNDKKTITAARKMFEVIDWGEE